MPLLDSQGNIQKPRGPRRTECSKCGAILIDGEGGQESVSVYGKDFVVCPGCSFVQLVEKGMNPEQMMKFDIVYRAPSKMCKGADDTGWGVGMCLSIKGIHNKQDDGFQMVFTEEQLRDFIAQIEEAKIA